MKKIIFTLFLIPLTLGAQINTSNTVLLELYTSQGCSSCPPADEILNEVKGEQIIALSYHVDYWNYIGWKDPFSKKTYSNKQQQYASKFNSSSVYTPQLVINGKEHIVGSKEKLVNQKISEYSKIKSTERIAINNVVKSNNTVNFNYVFNSSISGKVLRVVLVINERKTSVKRGENRNRELVNSNIVVNEYQLQLERKNGKSSILIPELVKPNEALTLILIVENDDLDILAATQKAI